MSDIIKMDIFFVIVSVVLLVVMGLFTLVALRFLRILGDLTEVSGMVKEEAQRVRNDVRELRANIRAGGVRMKYVADLFRAIYAHVLHRKRAHK